MITFARTHWVHILCIPILGLTVFTFLHEAAHAVVVILQGGEIKSFNILPVGKHLGMVHYTAPVRNFSHFNVSIAPYIMWLALVLIAVILSYKIKSKHFFIYSSIFIWLYVMPLGDIGGHFLPYMLFNDDNDIMHAFGPSNSYLNFLIIFATALSVFVGYHVHRRLYGDNCLSPLTYTSLSTISLAAIIASSSF